MKKINIILLVLIFIGLGLLATQNYWVDRLVNYILTYDKTYHSNEEKWTGKVTKIDNSCIFDGICSLTVDNKKVIISGGFRMPDREEAGDLTSVNNLGGLDNVLGKKVSVYAKKTDDGNYTIYGSKNYYIRVITN